MQKLMAVILLQVISMLEDGDILRDITKIQELVGAISPGNLKYVECYVATGLGIFIPSVGFCEYAVTPRHIHPSYSFILYSLPQQSLAPLEIDLPADHYLVSAISPDIPHEEKTGDSFIRYIAICIDKALYENIYAQYTNSVPKQYIWKQFSVDKNIMLYIKKFLAEYQDGLQGYQDILENLGTIITHHLIRGLLQINGNSSIIYEKFEIEKAVQYMQQNFGKKVTVRQLAAMVNMSESHFIRCFKKETELSPMEFLIKLRVEKAKKLLQANNLNITDISLQCGFSSASHFSASFAKHAGLTPSEFQKL
jgi:AraC-like DNA-binding protein